MQKFLRTLALVALAAPLVPAQIPAGATPLTGPITHVGVYDMATGVLTPGMAPPPPPGSALVYDNSAGNGSLFAAGAGLVNMDWGILSAGGMNDITSIDIGYATSSLTPVDLTIRLHEGATGFGDAGTTVTSIAVSGLPASASGGFEGFIVTVDLVDNIKLLDGPIGYSYEAADDVTGPLLVGPPNEVGVADAFDQYDNALNPLGTFFFGGVPFASFHMALTGEEPECLLVFGGGVGDDLFTPGSHGFNTGLANVIESYPVLMDDYPSFVLPSLGAVGVGEMAGGGGTTTGSAKLPTFVGPRGEFSVQIMMWNPADVPGNPEQYSPVIVGRIMPDGTVWARAKGQGDIDIEVDVSTNAKGETVLSFPFTVQL